MKKFVNKIIKKILPTPDLRPILYNNQAFQRQLHFYYQFLKNQKLLLPAFQETGFRVYSQNDEDGLFLYIFSQIGTKNKVLVDVAFGSPYGANTTNLICNWGWTGLLIEGGNVDKSKKFFDTHPDTFVFPPKIKSAWVTAENINELLRENGITDEIDLLSLDVDGVDYWLWKSLKEINPRVVVLEYMNIWGPDKAMTVPYKPDFNRFDTHPDFFGASLLAFVKLGKEKGYRLIGCNKYGFNAFFIRNDIGIDVFPEISPDDCLKHPQALDKNRLSAVEKLGWIEV
ncbi:MAG: hypothetical protein WA102_06685 [Candidatus Methanoperedens sp.]